MKNVPLPRVSLEAISYQGKSLLYFDLVALVDNLRLQPDLSQRSLDGSGLSAIIKKRTKMNVIVRLQSDGQDDGYFYAEPPLLDAGNPFYELISKISSADERSHAIDRYQRAVRLAKESTGWVDLKLGQVGGLLATLPCYLYLSRDLIYDRNYSSEELAAMILHELGHIYSFFETLWYTSVSNMVISTAVDAMKTEADTTVRIKLVSQALGAFGTVDPEAASLIGGAADETSQRVLFLKTFEEGERQRVKQLVDRDDTYNVRSIEFMADQFAVRHGATLALANAQHKMAMRTRSGYGINHSSFLAAQAVRYALLAGVSYVVPPLGLVIGVVASLLQAAQVANDDVNPDPIERLTRLKGDLVQLLKNTRLSPQMRKQILQDIEALDALRTTMKENGGLFRFIWRNVAPAGRRRSTLREMQKGLEDLINNDLFTQAARIRSL